ncbi:MAG: hypothetical protein JNN04_04385 [Cyclobacteriaceae bacterium]|nr:hypothetical protein [Cyclobacteriaceae bacterium]
MKNIIVALLFSALLGCQSQDPLTRVNVLNELTSGSSRSWKIESATLTNSAATGELSVTSLANVSDDEFVFSICPDVNVVLLDWKIRNQVRASATTANDVLLDYYVSSLCSSLTIQNDGSITSDDPNLSVTRKPNGRLSVQYLMNGAQFNMDLGPAGETTFVPATLDFEFLTDIVSTDIGLEQAAGFTGSMASNSLYLAYRASAISGIQPERVVRYDMDDGTFTTRDFFNSDFVTKELHIINDELKVVGAKFVNTYPLDLASDPVSVPHNLTITRYGSTVVDDNVFLFGGDLLYPAGSPGTPGPDADKIFRHDQASGQLHEVGALPEPRYWAHGEIVDGNLYVFGGRKAFITETAEEDIFVHDMSSGKNRILKLPTPMHRTFAARYGHLIYVAGYRENPNADPALTTIDTTFGVFDTHTGTFTVIPNTLALSGKKTVFGLTIVGNSLYALIGTWGVTTFSIYRVALAGS